MADLGAIGRVQEFYILLPLAQSVFISTSNVTDDSTPTVNLLLYNMLWDIGSAQLIDMTDVLDSTNFVRNTEQIRLSGEVVDKYDVGADLVVVHKWADKRFVTSTIPQSNGEWDLGLSPGTYSITYLKQGYQPVTHGPYTVE